MIAYKGMCPGMVCLGYQLKMGLNVTEQANCQANGFHCAANPMDCLRYYGDFQNSEYYLVRPCGDLDEDAVDSRISCTQLWVLRKLESQEFFLHALAYMADHPQMPDGCDVKRERAQAWNGYAVVRGKHPFRAVRNNDGLGLFFCHGIRLLQSHCPDTHPIHRRCSRFCPQAGLPPQPEVLHGASTFSPGG